LNQYFLRMDRGSLASFHHHTLVWPSRQTNAQKLAAQLKKSKGERR
jgi:hypothetical protein